MPSPPPSEHAASAAPETLSRRPAVLLVEDDESVRAIAVRALRAQGVTQEKVDAFYAEAQAHADWWKAAEGDAARVLPLGEATAAAAQSLRAVLDAAQLHALETAVQYHGVLLGNLR